MYKCSKRYINTAGDIQVQLDINTAQRYINTARIYINITIVESNIKGTGGRIYSIYTS